MNSTSVGRSVIIAMAALILVFTAHGSLASDLVQISGTINQETQFVSDDGEVYEIANTLKGEALADEVGVPVLVNGIVEEHDGVQVIKVIDFKVMNDDQ